MKCPFCGYEESTAEKVVGNVIKGGLGIAAIAGLGWLLGPGAAVLGTGLGATLLKKAGTNAAKETAKKIENHRVQCPKCNKFYWTGKDYNQNNNTEEK